MRCFGIQGEADAWRERGIDEFRPICPPGFPGLPRENLKSLGSIWTKTNNGSTE
jgi:hypothetical protein